MLFAKPSKEKLIDIINQLPDDIYFTLDEMKLKGQGMLSRKDFVWYGILRIFAFIGNEKTYETFVENEILFNIISFDNLSTVTDSNEFINIISKVFKDGKIALTQERVYQLMKNFEKINYLGCVLKAKEKALRAKGIKGKLEFIKQFHGIGDIYGMKFWMDTYHEDFQDQMVISQEIRNITKVLGLEFDFQQQELLFYKTIADKTGLSLWDLDRLFNRYSNIFINKLMSF